MEETPSSRHFSASEIARLEDGLPCLAQWSDTLLVPFIVYRLCSARVAWINRRWFLERGFDLARENTRCRVRSWLLEEFAWCVRSGSAGFASDTRTVWADRYGSTDGKSPHGGSGRVATLGRFQAKGIGQTPLVGEGAKAGHTHGCLSLAECVREAIWAEIAAAEFPHGAVPVIAVLDTGLDFSSPDPADQFEQNVGRGLLIRPAVIRPAHAQRAPLFKHPVSGFSNRQSDDVIRTCQVVHHWAVLSRTSNGGSEGLDKFVRSAAEQIAFGQVSRLFSGGYFSSNVSIHGDLLDFGNTHALPNWSRAQVHSRSPGLGDEMRLFPRVLGSLAFYFAKYGQHPDMEALTRRLLMLATKAYTRAWRRYGISLFQAEGLPENVQDTLHNILRKYFAEQQRHRVKYKFGIALGMGALPEAAWLYDALVDEAFPTDTPERRVLSQIVAYLRANHAEPYVALSTAVRLLMPRTGVDRRSLLDTIASAVTRAPAGTGVNIQRLDRLIAEVVGAARRWWPRLPPGYGVIAHTAREGSSALLCAERADGPRAAWLEGITTSPGNLHWFDHRFDKSDFKGLELRESGAYWWAMCPARKAERGVWRAQLPGGEMALPGADVSYPMPAGIWR